MIIEVVLFSSYGSSVSENLNPCARLMSYDGINVWFFGGVSVREY
jgi:hypothetical protein